MPDKPINIGDLRHRITLATITDTPDAFGDISPENQTLTEFATVWAKIEPLSGREIQAAKGVGDTSTHKITIRYLQGVDLTTMKILYPDTSNLAPGQTQRKFNIDNTSDFEERHHYIVMTCTEWLHQ